MSTPEDKPSSSRACHSSPSPSRRLVCPPNRSIVPSLCHLTSCPGIVYSDLATVGPDASSRSPGSCSRCVLVATLCAQRYLASDRSSSACGGRYRGREHDILVSYISSSRQIRQYASRRRPTTCLTCAVTGHLCSPIWHRRRRRRRIRPFPRPLPIKIDRPRR